MENYCRLCAERKDSNKLLSLDNNKQFYNEIIEKLSFINDVIANFYKYDSTLPTTVCIVCHESLNQTCDFISKVRKAQEILASLFHHREKHDFSDAETFDDRDDFKNETDSNHFKELVIEIDTDVPKNVIKEEFTNVDFTKNNFKATTQTLNVQDILGIPSNEAGSLYAQEVNDISKNTKFWYNYRWICSICELEFKDMNTLRSHSKLVHLKCSSFMCLDCKFCGENVDFNTFIWHVTKHRRNLRKCCHYCNLHFSKPGKLKNHIKSIHFSNSNTPCNVCGEILNNPETLKEHLILYTTYKPKRKPRRKKGVPITVEELTCQLCQKVYKTLNSLRDHMRRHEVERNRNFTCEKCGKAFYSKGTLSSHIMSHEKTKRYSCKICDKSFTYPNMLRRHVEMHSGVKPFSCEQCGKCFRLQHQMKAHKIVHTDKMPYACQFCSKAFRFKQILKNHEHQHTGVKPYSCIECGMQFTNWSNYNKHMKRRHNIDTSKKKITPEGVFPINPETGQLVQVIDESTEKWKSQIMVAGKWGRKKKV